MPEKPISLPYTSLKELLLDYVKYANFDCSKKGMIHQVIKNSTTSRCSVFHEDWRKFHAFYSCKFSNSKCFKCGDVGHIQSVCSTNVHLIATNIKSCNSDSTESSIYNDDLSLPTIAIDSVESQSSSELNQIQNSCKTTVSNQSIYQNSRAYVPGRAFPNDSYISDDISYKSEENMLNKHIHYQKPHSTHKLIEVNTLYESYQN
ncbi:unnamed protein product [Schistosoma margrebowiei]|uniref:Uncharacterized protein n=1 Tax=Schistosoma margrebowiei TaxID=48269 RepID=A0A183NCC3_9TREM|nr:unnamed protein product [Schistosoma margrebowiei]